MRTSPGRKARQGEAEDTVILVIDGSTETGSGRCTLIEAKEGRFFITVRSVGEARSMLAAVAIDAIHFAPGTADWRETQLFRTDVAGRHPLIRLVDLPERSAAAPDRRDGPPAPWSGAPCGMQPRRYWPAAAGREGEEEQKAESPDDPRGGTGFVR